METTRTQRIPKQAAPHPSEVEEGRRDRIDTASNQIEDLSISLAGICGAVIDTMNHCRASKIPRLQPSYTTAVDSIKQAEKNLLKLSTYVSFSYFTDEEIDSMVRKSGVKRSMLIDPAYKPLKKE